MIKYMLSEKYEIKKNPGSILSLYDCDVAKTSWQIENGIKNK